MISFIPQANVSALGGDEVTSEPERFAEEFFEESKVYAMLFKQCDTEGRGEANIDDILHYIQTIQLEGEPQLEGEEVFESHLSVSASSSCATYVCVCV